MKLIMQECFLNQEVKFEIFTEALRTYVDLAEENNFAPIVTYTPSAHTAYVAYTNFDNPSVKELMSQFSQQQRDFFKTKADELGYVFIDMTPAMQAAVAPDTTPETLLYYQTNLHLTDQGHQVVADTLSQALQDLTIVTK